MSWNHRVWRSTKGDDDVYTVRETYYNKSGHICACTENAANAYAYSLGDLEENLRRMLAAVESSGVLVADGFKFADWDK